MAIEAERTGSKTKGGLLPAAFYRPEVRQVVYQVLLVLLLGFAAWWVVTNVQDNLRRQNIASGFDFLWRRSGFDISQTLIEYSSASTYAQAFLAGLFNTILVAVLGIVSPTVTVLMGKRAGWLNIWARSPTGLPSNSETCWRARGEMWATDLLVPTLSSLV